ncbi:MAG: hypothetical protein AAF633_24815 [Chloroflexota bacterium]
MNHVLLYMPNHENLEKLRETVEQNSRYTVHVVNSLREASGLLTWQTIDLALITVTRSDSIVYSLRLLQPELPILLIAEINHQYVTERQRKWAWGVVTYDKLLNSFPKLDLLNHEKDQIEAIFLAPEGGSPAIQDGELFDRQNLTKAIRIVQKRFDLRLVLLTRPNDLIGVHRYRNNDEMINISRMIRSRWDARPRTELITSFESQNGNGSDQPEAKVKKEESESIFLITRPFRNFLLTIGGSQDQSLVYMRQIMRLIISALNNEALLTSDNFEAQFAGEIFEPHRFAIVWKPINHLSNTEKLTLSKILPQIGKLHGCATNDVDVQDDYVQVISTCPPHRNSTWLVHMYKQMSEKYLTKKLQKVAPFWAAGFHVRESVKPLQADEISIAFKAIA